MTISVLYTLCNGTLVFVFSENGNESIGVFTCKIDLYVTGYFCMLQVILGIE
jgi:hypothetical protein